MLISLVFRVISMIGPNFLLIFFPLPCPVKQAIQTRTSCLQKTRKMWNLLIVVCALESACAGEVRGAYQIEHSHNISIYSSHTYDIDLLGLGGFWRGRRCSQEKGDRPGVLDLERSPSSFYLGNRGLQLSVTENNSYLLQRLGKAAATSAMLGATVKSFAEQAHALGLHTLHACWIELISSDILARIRSLERVSFSKSNSKMDAHSGSSEGSCSSAM